MRREVKATQENIAKSLEGNWREELLFILRQQVDLYHVYQRQIAHCDLQLRKHLESFGSKVDLKAQARSPDSIRPRPARSPVRARIPSTEMAVLQALEA